MTANASPKPRPSAGLGPAGRGLWRTLTAGYVFGTAELPILAAAARQLDAVAALEAAAGSDVLVEGSRGQTIVHPAIVEARLGRVAAARLLGSLAIPDDAGRPRTAASLRGQKAADSRWNRDRRKRDHKATERRVLYGEGR